MTSIRHIRCCDCGAVTDETPDDPVFACIECESDDCLLDTGAMIDTFTWHGIDIEVRYQPDWLTSFIAHLDVTSLKPERAALPFTETGYRSHFLDPGIVEAAGGPIAFVTAWLDEAAKDDEWRERESQTRQLSLFD